MIFFLFNKAVRKPNCCDEKKCDDDTYCYRFFTHIVLHEFLGVLTLCSHYIFFRTYKTPISLIKCFQCGHLVYLNALITTIFCLGLGFFRKFCSYQ
ncbi:TPA: hypothetical protein GDD11_04465 [Legionella pneumophila]|nr:hypothetical protein [Legionella pneumophila]HAT9116862.1 hypothetical protein [Legionella pneumophila subsp. pneumophila]HAT8331154.1 hypothetical protein [Legionella pneumophila]HAT8738736.1 hypothetical protein [Legionella pneumophila]HAU0221581.1 hypothetical protein [Legionella pneumophila]